ncbi:MAG: NAD-dependent epimerase/dehydratase family protein [Hyphomicrobiaceae bacterium]|nr:NAD-dependent epimerase/dehydratase family protein [Hyphomicrobiaceae bacterium]
MTRTIVVTGASGYVAKHVIAEALRRGFRVRGTLRDMGKADRIATIMQDWVGDAASKLEFFKADLLSDDGWNEVMQGADALLHTAMIVYTKEPRDPEPVMHAAVDGTKRALQAVVDAGIGRVVMTSSIAAVGYGHGDPKGELHLNEDNWTNPEGIGHRWAYARAKTRAERAAWDLAASADVAFTTICPSMIIGPISDPDMSVSVQVVQQPLAGMIPAMPPTGFSAIDVRDLAEMHLNALDDDRFAGQRVLAAGEYILFRDIADILREAYPDRKIVKRMAPLWVLKLFKGLIPELSQIAADLETRRIYSRERGEALLGRPFTSAKQSVLDTAESLVRFGLDKG